MLFLCLAPCSSSFPYSFSFLGSHVPGAEYPYWHSLLPSWWGAECMQTTPRVLQRNQCGLLIPRIPYNVVMQLPDCLPHRTMYSSREWTGSHLFFNWQYQEQYMVYSKNSIIHSNEWINRWTIEIPFHSVDVQLKWVPSFLLFSLALPC